MNPKIRVIVGMVAVSGLLLIGSKLIAGQVIALYQGQTYALANGDVVACMGGAAPAPAPALVNESCRLMIGGLPPFYGAGQGYSDAEAKGNAEHDAQEKCHEYVIQNRITFIGGPGNNTPYDGCVPGPMNPSYYGCQYGD